MPTSIGNVETGHSAEIEWEDRMHVARVRCSCGFLATIGANRRDEWAVTEFVRGHAAQVVGPEPEAERPWCGTCGTRLDVDGYCVDPGCEWVGKVPRVVVRQLFGSGDPAFVEEVTHG